MALTAAATGSAVVLEVVARGEGADMEGTAGEAGRGVPAPLVLAGVLVPEGPNELTGAISFWSSPAETPVMYALNVSYRSFVQAVTHLKKWRQEALDGVKWPDSQLGPQHSRSSPPVWYSTREFLQPSIRVLLRSSGTTTSVRPMTCRTGREAGRGNHPSNDGTLG